MGNHSQPAPPVITSEHAEIGAVRFNARIERRIRAQEYMEVEAEREAKAKREDLDNDDS